MKVSLIRNKSGILLLFLIIWGILNLIQALLTPLNNDEAYYWMYSKYPAWGYFDHPPMIAIMIKAGFCLIRSELGVRLLVILSNVLSLIIIWRLISDAGKRRKGNELLFAMLIVLLPVFNIYGFIATPDSPLLLFTAVFLMAYKQFITQESWKNTFLLGLSMAALIYSKYHGGLLILIVIASNLNLLKNVKFYAASIVGAILFLPHVFWQFSNDFPSIKYHLVDRVSGLSPGHIPEYLLNLFVIQNPLILPVCIWLIFKSGTKDKFEKTLGSIVIGFIAFFLLASLRYSIQPQWTAIISIPMVIILLNNIELNSTAGNYIKWTTVFLLPVMLFIRIAFMFDFLPVSFLKKEYHNNKKWAQEISKIAGERPVVFTNSYQDPSEYTFYTGKFAHSLNNLSYRKTQYDIWDFEERLHGREVLYVPHYLTDYLTENLTRHTLSYGDSVYVKVIRDFQSLQRECIILDDDNYAFSKSGVNTIHFRIFNPYPYVVNLKHEEQPVVFQIAFLKNGNMEVKKNLELSDRIFLNVGDTISVDCQFTLEDLPAGTYKFGICSETGILYDTFNSAIKEVKITE